MLKMIYKMITNFLRVEQIQGKFNIRKFTKFNSYINSELFIDMVEDNLYLYKNSKRRISLVASLGRIKGMVKHVINMELTEIKTLESKGEKFIVLRYDDKDQTTFIRAKLNLISFRLNDIRIRSFKKDLIQIVNYYFINNHTYLLFIDKNNKIGYNELLTTYTYLTANDLLMFDKLISQGSKCYQSSKLITISDEAKHILCHSLYLSNFSRVEKLKNEIYFIYRHRNKDCLFYFNTESFKPLKQIKTDISSFNNLFTIFNNVFTISLTDSEINIYRLDKRKLKLVKVILINNPSVLKSVIKRKDEVLIFVKDTFTKEVNLYRLYLI